jgi:hypothetical protein
MHVQHSNPHTSTLGHEGHEYTALRDGVFDVPDEVGAQLLARPGWTRYYGEAPYEVASTPAAPPAKTEVAPTEADWYAKGRAAAAAGEAFATPAGLHPRSSEAREYKRGHDDAIKEAAGQA